MIAPIKIDPIRPPTSAEPRAEPSGCAPMPPNIVAHRPGHGVHHRPPAGLVQIAAQQQPLRQAHAQAHEGPKSKRAQCKAKPGEDGPAINPRNVPPQHQPLQSAYGHARSPAMSTRDTPISSNAVDCGICAGSASRRAPKPVILNTIEITDVDQRAEQPAAGCRQDPPHPVHAAD